jgi:outer membrane lipoprotein LolB
MRCFKPIGLVVLAVLAGCTPISQHSPVISQTVANADPQQGQFPDLRSRFWLDARISVKVERAQASGQQASARLLWLHTEKNDRVRLLSPFGPIVAELLHERVSGLGIEPNRVVLKLANGKEFQAPSMDELLEQQVGYPLPFEALPEWLMAKGSARAVLEYDELARPVVLREGLWEIRYRYDEDSRVPSNWLIESADGIELRVVPMQWLTGETVHADLMP